MIPTKFTDYINFNNRSTVLDGNIITTPLPTQKVSSLHFKFYYKVLTLILDSYLCDHHFYYWYLPSNGKNLLKWAKTYLSA